MGVDQDRRLAAGAQVSRMLAHPDAEGAFPARLPSGKRHVLVALPSDTVGDLIKRLAAHVGPVNVAVADSDDSIEVITFYRAAPTHGPEESDNCEVAVTSEVGLLLALLRRTRKATRVQLAKPKYDAELVDRESPAMAGL